MNHHEHHEGQGHGDHHHEMPADDAALTSVAVSATLHCLTGCAIGEVTGFAIGTALGFSDWGTIALAVALAFLFGYALTSVPLLRAGLALAAVIPIALAADTFSIAVMEIVDNAIMLLVPGAMEAGLADVLFWGALSFALAVAFVVALPVNRWLISRGKGHVRLHETGIHGGPSPRAVGTVLAVAAVFGTTVVAAEILSADDDEGHGGHETTASADDASAETDVKGTKMSDAGLRLELDRTELQPGRPEELSFRVLDDTGSAVRNFDVEHERRMHLIVVRRDLTGFQHLHPSMGDDGTWSTPLVLDEPGAYRVFADFTRGEGITLGADLKVAGEPAYRALSPPAPRATTATGYVVTLTAPAASPGEASELAFRVSKGGEPVDVEPYLGADGHLVALREDDLGFLHVHPLDGEATEAGGHEHGGAAPSDGIRFMTEFPSAGSYRLFLQFRHDGRVHTAEFTQEVA